LRQEQRDHTSVESPDDNSAYPSSTEKEDPLYSGPREREELSLIDLLQSIPTTQESEDFDDKVDPGGCRFHSVVCLPPDSDISSSSGGINSRFNYSNLDISGTPEAITPPFYGRKPCIHSTSSCLKS
jgi:hypothetical protein